MGQKSTHATSMNKDGNKSSDKKATSLRNSQATQEANQDTFSMTASTCAPNTPHRATSSTPRELRSMSPSSPRMHQTPSFGRKTTRPPSADACTSLRKKSRHEDKSPDALVNTEYNGQQRRGKLVRVDPYDSTADRRGGSSMKGPLVVKEPTYRYGKNYSSRIHMRHNWSATGGQEKTVHEPQGHSPRANGAYPEVVSAGSPSFGVEATKLRSKSPGEFNGKFSHQSKKLNMTMADHLRFADPGHPSGKDYSARVFATHHWAAEVGGVERCYHSKISPVRIGTQVSPMPHRAPTASDMENEYSRTRLSRRLDA